MANYFPCPNPACTYQFDADQLPAAAMVTCPICRTRFPYRAAAPAVAKSASPFEQDADDRPSRSESRAPQRGNRLVNPRPLPKANKANTAMMLIGFTVVMLIVLIGISLSMKRKWFKETDTGGPYVDQNFNFSWTVPSQPDWHQDDKRLSDRLACNAFLYKKQNSDGEPAAWIGLHCWHIGGGDGIRNPFQNDLQNELLSFLRNFDGLQRSPIQAAIAKQTVNGFQFDATLKDPEGNEYPVLGEAYSFSYKGIGYVMAMWAPKEKWEGVQKELVALRDNFQFSSLRDKWTEKVSSTAHFSLDDWEIEDATGKWKQLKDDPTDWDEKAKMLLKCRIQKGKDLVPEAKAMVLVFSDGGGSVDDVVKYLSKKDADFKFEASNKPSPSSSASVGTFFAKNSVDRHANLFYAISVLKVNGHNVSVVASCKEGDVEQIESYVTDLAASLKAK